MLKKININGALFLLNGLLTIYLLFFNLTINLSLFSSEGQFFVLALALFLVVLYFVSCIIYAIKKNQNILKDNNQILSRILENATNGIQFIDTEGKTRIINPAAEKIYANQRESYGKYDWELYYDGKKFDVNGKYTSFITETLETGKNHSNIERTITDKEGRKKVYNIETFRLFDDNGELLGAMGIYTDITDQQEIHRQLLDAHYEMANMAVTDELTKVYNVRYFRQRLNEEVAKAYNSNLSLLMIDADYFKVYNDLFGHQAGDKVLQRLAQLIKENVREADIVARYGGEEFTVILPGMKKQNAREVAERIRSSVSEFYFRGQEKLPKGKLTVTIGVASIPEDAKTSEELIRIADNALYRGKYATRDMVVADGEKGRFKYIDLKKFGK